MIDENKEYTVNLANRTCSCNRFQVDKMPCTHASAVLKEMNLNPYEYCCTLYMKKTMLATYEGTIYPVGPRDEWEIPTEISEQIILPPIGKARAGRPRMQRYKVSWEGTKSNHCGKCGKTGHNRRRCKNTAKE